MYLYDFKENKIITAVNINISDLLTTMVNYQRPLSKAWHMKEITITLDDKNVMWAVDWYQLMYNNRGGLVTNYKKELHIEKSNIQLYGCFIKSYSCIEDNLYNIEINIDHCSISTDDKKYLYTSMYREGKLDILLS
jgi:hypothetical protein